MALLVTEWEMAAGKARGSATERTLAGFRLQ
jgi:hypothetical protein